MKIWVLTFFDGVLQKEHKICIRQAPYLLLFALTFIQLKAQSESNFLLEKFDSIIGYSNSGIYYGKPNTEYPNTDRQNHAFFKFPEYQKSSLVYQDQVYHNVQIRYDLVNDELQLLPDSETELLGITLFSEFLDGFSIDGHRFIKIERPDSGSSFYELLLDNRKFKLLQKHHKKALEKLNGGRSFYLKFRYETDTFISSNGMLQKLRSKRQLLQLFPEDKETLKALFKKNASGKKGITSILKDWHALIVKQGEQ